MQCCESPSTNPRNELLDLEVPLIAAVNGPAIGLGASLALLCDVIFMADTATLADPHVRVGIVAGDGGAIRHTKIAVNKLVKDALNVAFDYSTAAETLTMASSDHKEAVAAIREKRPPVFRGR